MFGRATIRLGIGPHSSCFLFLLTKTNQQEHSAVFQDNIDVHKCVIAYSKCYRHKSIAGILGTQRRIDEAWLRPGVAVHWGRVEGG